MKKYGFTLIELLIVMMIIAILAGAMVPFFKASQVQAQRAKATAEVDSIRVAAILYHNHTGLWPWPGQTGYGLTMNMPSVANWNGPYLDTWSNDPWNLPYQIYDTGSQRRIRSKGQDETAETADDIDFIMTPNTNY